MVATRPPISSEKISSAGVAERAGHARDGRHLAALEEIGRHRDDGDRERLVREAAEAEQRDGGVGALDDADEAHPHHQQRAEREGPLAAR